ncbi:MULTISPECIES: hypothetical protein [unclassified Micromonospora]|uniref:hypothetical protein n=1 Tax=unclassified Micromonospora TaxID=2617518 RepID=UPI0036323201
MTLVLVGTLSWTAGLWPDDESRATVDHCYVTYDRLEVMHSRCVGNWTRGGRGHQGPIHGVEVEESWKVVNEDASNAYEWEVVVPASAKQPWVLADSRQARTPSSRALPWGLIPASLAALLVALTWSVTATVEARRRAPSCVSESAGSTATV